MDGQRTTIHPLSGIAPLPQFELWSVPGTQISVSKDIITDARPLSALSASQPIEFVVNSAIDEYINLGETYLYIKCRVKLTRDDKTAPTAADWNTIVPAQYFLHTMFSQCDVKIGDKEVTQSPQTYHYKAFIEALLGFTSSAKKTFLRASLWTKTNAERAKIITAQEGTSYATHGKWFEMMGRLHIDLAFQEKFLIGGSEVKIKLNPNDPKVYFQAGEGLRPELELSEVVLKVHKAKVTPTLVSAHLPALADNPARYAITRTEVRYQGIPQGQLDAMLENVIRGQVPRRIIVALVDTTTFNGNYSLDPFYFKHFDVNYIAAYLDGVQYPSTPFTPDFTNSLYTREYMELFCALNQNRSDTYTDLDMDTYANGKTMFAFDFSPDLSNGPGASGHVNCITRGTLRLHFRFKSQLTQPVNVLIYCEFDNMIEIDVTRNARTNFN